jgi:hypothetical protein
MPPAEEFSVPISREQFLDNIQNYVQERDQSKSLANTSYSLFKADNRITLCKSTYRNQVSVNVLVTEFDGGCKISILRSSLTTPMLIGILALIATLFVLAPQLVNEPHKVADPLLSFMYIGLLIVGIAVPTVLLRARRLGDTEDLEQMVRLSVLKKRV